MGKKSDAIIAFLGELKSIRQSVRDDGLMLLQKLDIKTLADPSALRDFLSEMAAALTEKHLIKGNKVQAGVASAVRRYVAGMARKK